VIIERRPLMQTDENKRFLLKLIEDSISRMSSNSFLIKGWALTVISGLITLYITKSNHKWAPNLLILSMVVCLIFWINDTYYLYQEQRFRFLYEKVRKTDSAKINFSMNLPKESLYFFIKCMFRPIFCISYLIVLTILIIYILHVDHVIIKF